MSTYFLFLTSPITLFNHLVQIPGVAFFLLQIAQPKFNTKYISHSGFKDLGVDTQ